MFAHNLHSSGDAEANLTDMSPSSFLQSFSILVQFVLADFCEAWEPQAWIPPQNEVIPGLKLIATTCRIDTSPPFFPQGGINNGSATDASARRRLTLYGTLLPSIDYWAFWPDRYRIDAQRETLNHIFVLNLYILMHRSVAARFFPSHLL